MGLEVATYISDLVDANPGGGDPKSQGDDHLRLIKEVLQATFPGHSRASRLATYEATTVALTLDITDDRRTIVADLTSVASFNITLPTLGAGDAGWEAVIMRSDTDMTKRLGVIPAAGTIDGLSTIGVWKRFLGVTFFWTGTTWLALGRRDAGLVDECAASVAPPGSLFCFGQAVSRTTYAEVFAAITTSHGVGNGTTTFNLPDHRDVVIIGKGNMGGASAGRITSAETGLNTDNLAATAGVQSLILTTAQIPSHLHTAGSLVAESGGDHGHPWRKAVVDNESSGGVGGLVVSAASQNHVAFTGTPADAAGQQIGGSGTHNHDVGGSTSNAGSGASHTNLQPSLVANKVIWLG